MHSILKNAPAMKEKNLYYRVLMLILTAVCSSFLLAPVIVGYMSNFTTYDQSSTFCLFKGLFAFTLIIFSILYFVTQKIYSLFIPSLVGFITSLFPLFRSIGDYQYVKSVADKFSMSQDYSAYYISIAIYLAYTLLCILTGLYVTGYFKWSIIILVISAISSLATLFVAIDKAITYDAGSFEILTFLSTSFTSLIPVVAVSSSQRNLDKTKSTERNSK